MQPHSEQDWKKECENAFTEASTENQTEKCNISLTASAHALPIAGILTFNCQTEGENTQSGCTKIESWYKLGYTGISLAYSLLTSLKKKYCGCQAVPCCLRLCPPMGSLFVSIMCCVVTSGVLVCLKQKKKTETISSIRDVNDVFAFVLSALSALLWQL